MRRQQVRRWKRWAAVSVTVAAVGCAGEGDPSYTSRPPPPEDGERVIAYDVDVMEDDSRCNAAFPYKPSQESLVVEWWTDRDITMYARGGLYVTDVHLDDNGEYLRYGTTSKCLLGSYVWGRMTRQRGEGKVFCRKVECDVIITSVATRRVASPDAGPPSDGGGLTTVP